MKSLVVLLCLLMTAMSFAKSTKKSVFVDTLKKEELFDSFIYPARVIPQVNATIYAENDGVITKIVSHLGDQVNVGADLARVKHTDPVYRYRSMGVKAPVAGIVSKVYVTEGTLVTKNQKLFGVTDPKKVRVVIEVSSNELEYIRKGLQGEFHLQGSEDKVLVEVVGVSPLLDPATGTATAMLQVKDEKQSLPLGQLGKVTFKSNVHFGLKVPDDAVIYHADRKNYLRILNDNKVKRVEVKLGKKQSGLVEVLDGVSEGQTYVKRTSGYLIDGEEVEVQGQNEKDASKKDEKTKS